MKTQKLSYKKTVNNFIKRYNPYEGAKPLGIDLVAYMKYVKENKTPPEQLTPELVQKFTI